MVISLVVTAVLPVTRPYPSSVTLTKLPELACVTVAKSMVGSPETPLPSATAMRLAVPVIVRVVAVPAPVRTMMPVVVKPASASRSASYACTPDVAPGLAAAQVLFPDAYSTLPVLKLERPVPPFVAPSVPVTAAD